MQVKIWFQNRRSKVKKLVRHSDVQLTPAGDEMKTDQMSSCSADADVDADDDDDDDDDHGVIDNKHSDEYHTNTSRSSPSPASQSHHHHHHQQLSHQPSSWDDVPPSFQRLPALTQLHHNYPVSSSDDVRHSAVDCATKSNWTDSYSSSVDRLQLACAVSDSQLAATPRQLLFHDAVHQWYATNTAHITTAAMF